VLPALGLTLVVSLLLAAGLVVPAPPAAADEPEAWASVSIDQMVPALPARDGRVRLRGSVTNTSEAELSNLQAVFWRSLDPITDAEGMERALTSAANEPLGARVQPDTRFQNIPSDDDRTLDPGERAAFDLTVDVADLELPRADAVYLIGVHIRGRTVANGPDLTVGRGRTFLPLVDSPPDNALRMTSLVVLSSRPGWSRPGVLVDDHLAGEVAAGGRLRALLDAAGGPGVSYAVDPALIEDLQTMENGYSVLDEDGGDPEPGRGQVEAGRWLADFADLVRSGDGFRLPYGNPDIAALVHDQQAGVLDRSVQAGLQVAATRSLPLLVLPGNGRADRATVEAAAKLDPAAIVLSDLSAGGNGPLLDGPGSVPIVSYTAEAFGGGGPGPAPRRTPVKLRQRMLSDTWLEASTAPADQTVGRVRLITSADQAVGADPELDTPWLRPTTLSDLLRAKPSPFDTDDLRYGARARAAEIDLVQLGAVRQLSEDYAAVADLFVQPGSALGEGRRLPPRVASTAWRRNAADGLEYARTAQQSVTDVLRDEIRITATSRVTTTGRTASFPITVSNGLPAATADDDTEQNAVRVVLRFESATRQRLTVAPLELVVPADGRVTDNAVVSAQTNGTVRVTAQLYTSSGRRVGRPVPIEVNATQAGTTGWFIALAAGVVLIGSTALRIRQVARERGGAPTGTAVEPLPVSGPAGGSAETLDV
jgi:hypothetical protein